MTWFLRLFPAYRALIAERDALQVSVVRMESYGSVLQGLLDAYKEQSEDKNRRIEDLTSQLVETTQKSADFVARMKYGRSIFGDMPDVAIDLEKQRPIEHPRAQAFDLVKQAEQQFSDSLKPKTAKN